MRYKGSLISATPPVITPPSSLEAGGTAPGVWTTEQQLQAKQSGDWPRLNGESVYTTPGTYTFVAPANITSVSVVCVGASLTWASNAKYGRGGGGLGYKNNIAVTPGSSYTVVVGTDNVDSYFISAATVKGGSATGNSTGGTFVGDGGGNGGDGGTYFGSGVGAGGGGAGGYAGNGGNGAPSGAFSGSPAATNSGGGGGGAGSTTGGFGGGGGGVGLYGIGADGVAGIYGAASNYVPGGGGGGSGGETGSFSNTGGGYGMANYGGGVAGTDYGVSGGTRRGAVRIVYPGNLYTFPNNAPQTGS